MPNMKQAIDKGIPVAIFARNHREHLECAERRSRADKRTTFLVPGVWRAAQQACDAGLRPPVYFAVVRDGSGIQYVATLEKVIVDDMTSPAALALLADRPCSDANNDGQGARTIYTISGCGRVGRKLDMTKLDKLSDGKPISDYFGYSYVPVYAVPDA